jgi:hypothetical protein
MAGKDMTASPSQLVARTNIFDPGVFDPVCRTAYSITVVSELPFLA